jgi:hypothetical protein
MNPRTNYSNLLLPVQKIKLIQYQSKTPFQKFLWNLDFYIKWVTEWLYYWLCMIRKEIDAIGNEMVEDVNTILKKTFGITIFKKEVKKVTFQAVRNVPETINHFMNSEYQKWEILASKVVSGRDGVRGVGNGNMDTCFYNETEFKDIYMESILQENKEMEQKWQNKTMMTWVPMIGNVIMYYDFYKMAFCYYCDMDGVNYNVMNACVMKYVMMFHCMDLFVDELVHFSVDTDAVDERGDVIRKKIPWTTPVLKIQKIVDDFHLDLLDSDIPNHRDIYSKVKSGGGGVGGGGVGGSHKGSELFAKFKQYRSEINVETLKIRNKIIYKGRIRDFIKVEKKCVYVGGGSGVVDLEMISSRNRLSDSESEGLEDCEEDDLMRTVEGVERTAEERVEERAEEEENIEGEKESEKDKKKINLSIDEILYTHKIQNLIDWDYLKEPETEDNKKQYRSFSYKDFKKKTQQQQQVIS